LCHCAVHYRLFVENDEPPAKRKEANGNEEMETTPMEVTVVLANVGFMSTKMATTTHITAIYQCSWIGWKCIPPLFLKHMIQEQTELGDKLAHGNHVLYYGGS
jgi:hypothetical protein